MDIRGARGLLDSRTLARISRTPMRNARGRVP
jgi:hypothetical protein